ncbi:phage portal protein [Heliobacterium gestii]|uniref:Phage portal protein n=1 Tax=Heliomicrobium gestii TaxID=2699 RepID=A0A845LAR6_HELGE|nr:phage tail tube protein [Heliomicrobium gestii]MBM7866006.1 hypothetical protein [Heliomicrobium gestii]MZP42661.1 phage portal protein [Heliomicrobium gestii]
MALEAKRIINGTFGECWLDGDKVSECKGLNAKVEIEKEDVPVCGSLGIATKMTGYKIKGTVKLYKVNSRMAKQISEELQQGNNPTVRIMSALRDPAAFGAERVLIKDACFDDLTLADWEVKKLGEVECPFTATSWEYLDKIEPKN